MNLKRRILSGVLIFALIFGQMATPIAVLAQEATASAQTSEPVITEPSPSPSATPQPSADPIATPSASPSNTPEPSSTPTATPSATPSTPSSTPSASPSATPTPQASASSSPTPPKRGHTLNKATEKAGPGRDQKYAEGQVIVKFKKDKTNLRSVVGSIKASIFELKHGLEKIDEIKDLNITVQKDDKTTQQLISELKNDPDVEYVEPNYYIEPRSLPNDTDFDKLWGLHNTGQNISGIIGTNDADIDAPEAWDIEKANQQDVVVAVIDSGVNYTHPELKDNMWDGTNCQDENNAPIVGGCPNHGWDFENNDNNPIDDNGHGSHIAGTIAASQNNSKGISGLSSKNNIKIMALKFGYTLTTVANEIRAINFAKNNGAKVINASYGGWKSSQAEKDAIANFPGLFIAAAGNSATDNDVTGDTPSGYDNENIIAVAATDNKDNLAYFSNWGKNLVDVGAPGVNIYSTTFETLSNTINQQNFDSVTEPNIPAGFTKTGNWGTYYNGPSFGNVLYGDVYNLPYLPNEDSTFTSPKFNMSGYSGARINFLTHCDTQKDPFGAYTDYMSLEASGDGTNFTEIRRWDEIDLPPLPEDTIHTGGYLYVNVPSSYLTQNFTYRFRWITNGDNNTGSIGDGCFIDDVKLDNTTNSGEKYQYKSGTSMATPHVVGEAAMIWSYKPELTISQVKDTILNSGDSISALQGKTLSGKRINLNNALRYVPQSSNADLSNLTISQGTLTPAFSPSIASYSATVANNITTIKVTPTAADLASSIKVNSKPVLNGNASEDIALNVGSNLISVVVTAQDQSSKAYTINVTRTEQDTQAPVVTISPNPYLFFYNKDLTFTVDFDDAVVKEYQLDNEAWKTYVGPILVDTEGYHTLKASGTDDAGNVGSTEVSFKIDKTAPVISLVKAIPSISNNPTPSITVNSTEDDVTLTTTGACQIQTYSWTPATGNFTIQFKSLKDGTYDDCILTMTDYAGNAGESFKIASFTIDTVLPNISISRSPDKNLSNTTYSLTVNFDDSVVKKYQIDAGSLTDYTGAVTVTAEGAHTFYTEGADAAGNQSSASVSFEIDKTAPNVVITKLPDKNISNSSYRLTVDWGDAVSKEYRINNGSWSGYPGEILITDEGSYVFEAKGVDLAGNSTTQTAGFTIDKTAPLTDFVVNSNDKYTNSKQVNLNFADTSADTVSVEIGEGVGIQFGSPIDFSPTIGYTLQDQSDGQKIIRVRLTDAAGNASMLLDSIILDTAAPAISDTSLVNKTTSNNSYVKNGDTLELQAAIADANLADISAADITANLSALGGSAKLNPDSFDKATGKAAWTIAASQTNEGFIQISIDAKDPSGNVAVQVSKTIEADNSIPVAKPDYFTTTKNTPILISSSLILANDTDSSGDILLVTQGADFIFTPQADFIGTFTLNYTITDGSNLTTGTVYITVTPNISDNQAVLQPNINLDKNKVVVVDVPFDSTINVPSANTNAGLDLSNVLNIQADQKVAFLNGKINVNAATTLGNVALQIPQGITITGPISWDGSLNLPTVLQTSTVKPTASSGTTATTTAVVEVGLADTKLTLNKAVRLLIPNMASQKAGFVIGGVFTAITNTCASDSQAAADALAAEAECKIDSGSDLVIWTKHFTKFVTYTETVIPSQGGSTSSGSSNPGTQAVCSDSKPASAPKLLSATVSGKNQITLTWSKAADPVTYYLITYGLKSDQPQFGNPNIGDKNTTSYIVKGLSGGTTYYFKVRAGNNCMPGEFSNEISAAAYGQTTLTPAEGFQKGVLSTQNQQLKLQTAKPFLTPVTNIFSHIRQFILKLFSTLKATSYLPIDKKTVIS